MVTCGGVTFGYCATGIADSATRPASVMTMAMTIAKLGRWIKNLESMAILSPQGQHDGHGCGGHRAPPRDGTAWAQAPVVRMDQAASGTLSRHGAALSITGRCCRRRPTSWRRGQRSR